MTRPLVSVVIPFYNCPYIDQAIQSALSQTYTPLEIIVVDDGSTQHVDKITPYLPYINYLGKSNGGTATALNRGIVHATGQYVAWLSSDDIFYPAKINNQVLFMQEHYAYISYTNFNLIDAASNVTQEKAGASFCTVKDFYSCFIHGNPVNGCTVMMRKELFGFIGLFDEGLPYTHDFDLWYRVMLGGYYFPFLNESLTAYRIHDEMGSLRHQATIQQEIVATKARYYDPFVQFLQRLGG
ncbi:glycosyltransferase [Paenibacillus sp. IHBB 10380]|uniref:glycosyltransferase n=1 Tax=Paenibacillus sp. IHBB 10380 TaxID=1566358 RepID=UPI0005CFD0A2|nr:glycosyltransferase [Paenibacillus sp. IHBB 10380]AJS57463.1 glycosyl transferase [Paenibacillus sp. IHBB 10380]